VVPIEPPRPVRRPPAAVSCEATMKRDLAGTTLNSTD
jgi:hypothetical protein